MKITKQRIAHEALDAFLIGVVTLVAYKQGYIEFTHWSQVVAHGLFTKVFLEIIRYVCSFIIPKTYYIESSFYDMNHHVYEEKITAIVSVKARTDKSAKAKFYELMEKSPTKMDVGIIYRTGDENITTVCQ